jgi:hypothetical protein
MQQYSSPSYCFLNARNQLQSFGISRQNPFNSSELPSALLAAGSLARAEILKEVTPFS